MFHNQSLAACLVLTLGFAAVGEAQQQSVTPQPALAQVQVGDLVTTTLVYSTSPAAAELTGLGLRLHWASSALELVDIRSVLGTGLIAEGDPEPDVANFDNDSTTDTFVQVAWADLAGRWPGSPSADLLTVELRVLAGFAGSTRVRFSASSTASGWSLVPTPLVLTGESVSCQPGAETLCLANERFRVEVTWQDFAGNTGNASVVPVVSIDSGLLWFFDADNWEMLVKVLDGCAINDRFWVFIAATTDVQYTMTVTDTQTGTVRRYVNPLGVASTAITDTDAFSTCSAASGETGQGQVTLPDRTALELAQTSQRSSLEAASLEAAAFDVSSECTTGDSAMCLNQDRFQVEIVWRDFDGNEGDGQVVPFGSDDSGLFWFFDADNWEVLVKVLNGCSLNDHYWVFAAATTDVEYTLRVTDTANGTVKTYANALGEASPSVTDTAAFMTCP